MIDLKNISKQFDGKYLFDNVNLKINNDDRIALVGSNGSGKTTLLRMLSGVDTPESGEIIWQKGIKIGYLPQETVNTSKNLLFDEVKTSLGIIKKVNQIEENLENNFTDASSDDPELLEEIGKLNYLKEESNYYSVDSEIKKVLTGLGFYHSDFNRNIDEFSGGWLMRIELAKLLLEDNNLILLDEPTNHLDLDSLEWLIEYLKSYKGAIIIVSHDRHFINELTNKTLEIFNKKVSFFNGNFDEYQNFKKERDAQLIEQYKQQQKKVKETERFIERFRYKATKAKQVQSRVKQLEKMEEIELPDSEKSIEITFPEPQRSGAVPVRIENVSKYYGKNKVFDNLNLQIDRGDKIAFVGPNGAGKTTLAKLIAQKIKPSSGIVVIGYNTFISYYAQEVTEDLNPSLDILDTVREAAPEQTPERIRTILGSFLFNDEEVFKKVKVLSGGEKSRVALAKILMTKANLIVLDEPTNHLDMTSKDILQEALKNFSGTLILVSHDVDFIRPIVSKVIEIRPDFFKVYEGGIDYYFVKRQEYLENQEESKDVKPEENQKISKKEKRRIEAEQRQKRRNATKDLNKEIANLEKEIEKLEEQKLRLEEELADPEIFSNPEKAKDKNKTYSETKEQLEFNYEKWTELSDKLEQIESEFET